MLKSLFIQNFVLIDTQEIHFEQGFSVITGETGAGKSIILGALALVLGQRADGKSIKSGAEKCVIEAVFDLSQYRLESFFSDNDLEYDASCILRRELYASGRSRAFVNDSPVSLAILRTLGIRLIDIHSQHQNLLLGDSHFQLKVVDVMAENDSLLSQYKKMFAHYQSLLQEQAELKEQATKSKQEEDYIRFQVEQLDDASLRLGEQEELETEQETLSHAEEIKGALYKVADLLDNEERGGVQLLKEALSTVDAVSRYYPKAKEISGRIHSAYVDLNDLASETEVLKEDVEFNPERLDWVNDRLNTLYTLQQKHGVSTVEELIAIRDQYQDQLHMIDSFDERISQGKRELDNLYKELLQLSASLSEKRKLTAEAIASRLIQMISLLGMPNARFRIDIFSRKEPERDGMDEIQFMFSANRNMDLLPIAQTASGGEISRLMLCIKAMIAGFTALPTIIFDEVDTGVSGDIADKMGDIMQELGLKMQVIAITHLPQIAAKGQVHYLVCKEEMPDRTITRIKRMEKEERIKEIARMLSGASLTDASLANAMDLLGFKEQK